MKIKFILIFALLGLSCTPQPNGIEEISLAPSPTKIPVVDTIDATLVPTLTSAVSISSSQSCSIDRNIFGSYAEFSSNVSLVILRDNQISLLDVKTGEKTTYEFSMDNITRVVASPDGKRLSSLSINESEHKLWLFTPSVDEKPKSFLLSSDVVLQKWISDQKIGLWGFPDTYGCQQYIGFFDIETESVVKPLNKIPEMEQSRCIYLPSIHSSGLQALYPWQTIDLNSGNTRDILTINYIETNPPNYFLSWSNNNISMFSFKENSFSYTVDYPINKLSDQPIELKTITLPRFATKNSYRIPPITDLKNNLLGWDLMNTNESDNSQINTNFYLFDISDHHLIDYCLDRSVSSDGTPSIPQYTGYFSPDGKYFAWTIYSTDAFTPPIETQVLDLKNGKVVIFPEVEIFGWVIP